MRSRDSRIAYADALRLTAIAAVVLHHVFRFTNMKLAGHSHGFGYIGVWGVDCFFVLTGFLLSQRFFEAILGQKPFPSLREYFTRRFLRIYPLYFLALVVSIVVASAIGDVPSVGNVVAHITLAHGFFPQYTTQMNGPLWTMSVDAQFYLILPLLALLLTALARGSTEPQRVRLIWLTLGLIVAASILERAIALSLIPIERRTDPDWDAIGVLCRNAFGMGADFAIGAGIAFLGMRYPAPTRPKAWYIASLILGALFFIGLARWPFASHTVGGLYWVFADLLGGCSAGALLYGALRGNFAWLTRLVSTRAVIRGAELAYAIYLFHFLIMEIAVILYHRPLTSPLATLAFAVVVLVPILIVAQLAHRYVEIPGLRLRDQHREPVPTLP